MKKKNKTYSWLRNIIALAVLGFILNIPGLRAVRLVHAQSLESQTFQARFNWEYQLDFNATSFLSAKQQADSVTPGLTSHGVASELQSLGDSLYRLRMSGDQDISQIRQTLFSPLLAGFIGGVVEVEINMPVGSLVDTTFLLESNPSTGYTWEVFPSKSIGFAQAGDTSITTRSRGYGVPAIQTLILHPSSMGNGTINLVYRKPFQPDETITRHLWITLVAQATEIDLTDPDPQIISQADSNSSPNTINPIEEIPLKGALPASFDWRTSGIVPAIRDQGNCGGCWAFGTVGVMESAIAKAGGPMTDLSEQFLISCNTSGWDCNGGLTANMYHYNTLGLNQSAIGAVLEADKPYTQTNGTCTVPYNHPYILSGWQFIVATEFTMPTVDQIKNAIYTYGPVTAGVCADIGWNTYSGGVYNPTANSCDGSTNHQIILVGWDDATSSWIVRNQWGSDWGESGYMRITWDTTGSSSRVGEGTSWVTWGGAVPATFGKTSPANTSSGQSASPVLTWGASTGAASYEYCIDTSSNNTCNTSWITTGTSTSVSLSSLSSGTHSWQVRAVNTSGATEANGGNWWSFTVGQVRRTFLPVVFRPFPPPGAFNKIAPVNGATGQSASPTLSWGTSSNANSYEYCYDTINNSSCDATWTSTAASTSVPLSGLALSTSYYWQVRANNAGGPTYADGGAWWSFTTTTPSNTFNSIADACIMEGNADTNFGSTTNMMAGYDDYYSPDGKIVRSLVKFDLSAISTGTSINSATLYLYYRGYWDYVGYSRTISTYGINSSWSEGSVTWNTQPAIGQSYGSNSIVANSSWHWVSFDVTGLVRAWVDGSQTNYGILIRGPEWSGSDSSFRSFWTREGDDVPYLSISYTGSGSITPSQPPFGNKIPGGLAKSIHQILTGEPFNPLGPVSCLNPLVSGNATRCLLVP